MDAAGRRLAARRVLAGWQRWEVDDPLAAPWGYLVGIGPHGVLIPEPLPDHPRSHLRHWLAPPQWSAAALAVHGTTRQGNHSLATSREVRVVWLCDREGQTASILVPPGTAPAPAEVTHRPRPTDPGPFRCLDGRWPTLGELLWEGLRRPTPHG